MATNRYTVIYEDGNGKRYKLCRVLMSNDGSYFVTCPYHQSEKVFLSKRRINYANPNKHYDTPPIEYAILSDDDHRIKLSHHPDGFVQFSGEGIVSGRNADGSPKGLGLFSWPLKNPTAGPACGVSIQKPTAFKLADAPSKEDVVFRANESYKADKDNGLLIEMYYFPGTWRRYVRDSVRGPIVWLNHPSGATLELRVCMSPPDNWEIGFLGVDAWPCPMRLGSEESGYVISSPSGNLGYDKDGNLEGDAIYAAYPPMSDDVRSVKLELLFKPRTDPSYTKGGPSPSEA